MLTHLRQNSWDLNWPSLGVPLCILLFYIVYIWLHMILHSYIVSRLHGHTIHIYARPPPPQDLCFDISNVFKILWNGVLFHSKHTQLTEKLRVRHVLKVCESPHLNLPALQGDAGQAPKLSKDLKWRFAWWIQIHLNTSKVVENVHLHILKNLYQILHIVQIPYPSNPSHLYNKNNVIGSEVYDFTSWNSPALFNNEDLFLTQPGDSVFWWAHGQDHPYSTKTSLIQQQLPMHTFLFDSQTRE